MSELPDTTEAVAETLGRLMGVLVQAMGDELVTDPGPIDLGAYMDWTRILLARDRKALADAGYAVVSLEDVAKARALETLDETLRRLTRATPEGVTEPELRGVRAVAELELEEQRRKLGLPGEGE